MFTHIIKKSIFLLLKAISEITKLVQFSFEIVDHFLLFEVLYGLLLFLLLFDNIGIKLISKKSGPLLFVISCFWYVFDHFSFRQWLKFLKVRLDLYLLVDLADLLGLHRIYHLVKLLQFVLVL